MLRYLSPPLLSPPPPSPPFPYTTLFRSQHEELERKRALAWLDGMLATLDEPKRVAFILHEIEQLPMVEVAEVMRSEEHTSELQSLRHLVCRLLLEKKKRKQKR